MEHDGVPPVATSKETGGVKGWIESMFITVSQTFVGLPLFKAIDYFLNVVEKSTQWSLPAHEISAEENGKLFGKIELLRPLPWILFIPGLVILRVIRVGINVGAFIFGYPYVEPLKMVKFVQRCRRRLRTINLKAVKSSRRRPNANKDKLLVRSIRLTLSTLFCFDSSKLSPSPPPIEICVTGLDFNTARSPDETSTTESAGSPIPADRKRKLSQVSSDSESETTLTKLDKYASLNSEDDSDFNPVECSSQSSSSKSDDEREENISVSEVEDLVATNELFLDWPASDALPRQKTTRDTETETAAGTDETCVANPESETQIAACESNDFINGEARHELSDSTYTVSETEAAPPSSTQDVAAADGVAATQEDGDKIPDQDPKSSIGEDGQKSSHSQKRKHKPSKKHVARHSQKQENKQFLETEKNPQ
ncbi:uncharacterized protein LOC144473095 isoform X2 [Augochlora pura]